MRTRLRYYLPMRRVLAVVAVIIGMMAVPVLEAQINGTRPSVTSLGGSPIFPPGPPASVTSLGPRGYTPNFRNPNCCFDFRTPHHGGHVGSHGNGSGRDGFSGGRYGYGVGVLPLYSMPYSYGYGYVVDPVDDSMEQAYGPVAPPQRTDQASPSQQYNDERLGRLEQQMNDMENTPTKSQAASSTPKAPVADQPDTVLVFRDGHSIQVKNYAIVGDTIYDFSEGARHKIAIADLDLGATEKQNDARGLDFRLPTRPLGN